MQNNEQIVETATTTTENVETTVNEKTFTQKEFDEALQKAIARRTKNLPSNDELQSFNEWKKNNQNDSEKINELQSLNQKLENENKLLKATNEVAKSEVKPEFLKFVTSEIMSMVNETTDFETALKEYKKSSPQYFGEVVIKKVQSSPSLNAGGPQPQTTNDIMNNILRGAKNES